MFDSGYTDYSDPRLVPPDEGEEGHDCFLTCVHAKACRWQLARVYGIDTETAMRGESTRIENALEQEICPNWEESNG